MNVKGETMDFKDVMLKNEESVCGVRVLSKKSFRR